MTRRTRFVVIALALALTIPTLLARTRSAITASLGQSVAGTVHSVNGSMISILNGLVVIDATGARITSLGGDATLAAIVPGTRIHAILAGSEPVAENGALRAQMIVIDNPPEGNLTGAVQSIDIHGNTLELLGETIAVTPETVFVSPMLRSGAMTLADLHVGDPVGIDVATTASGLVARRIIVLFPSPRPGVHLTGTVKTIGSDQWIVTNDRGEEVSIKITPETKIGGNPNVGDRVEIFGHLDSSNQFVAVSIVKIVIVPRPISLRGTVKSIAPDSWTIVDPSGREVSFKVTSETKIVGSPAAGDFVEVLASTGADGSHVAITIMKSIAPGSIVIIVGSVKVIGRAEWTIAEGGIDRIIKITSSTRIDPSIVIGDRVEATTTRDAAGALTAIAIMRYGPEPGHLARFEGTVRSIEGHIWMVDSVRVTVGPLTQIAGDPRVGDKVRVTGWKSIDGSVLATVIEKIR
ncbi:MAG TPA: DUF5666 domain-containing protein [Thermoanaerobaculia bacterium]